MTVTRRRPVVADEDPSPDGTPEGAVRSIRPRRGLPGGRAVVGGLLVAVAAVGTFAAVSGAGRGPDAEVAVAGRDIAPGTVLTAADVRLVAMDLPAGVARRTFTSATAVAGAVAVGPLAAGELIQAGGLAPGRGAVPTFTLAVPTAAANGGRLQRGDAVQVFATYGSDVAATTRLLAEEAQVVGVDDGEVEIGVSGQVQVTLAIRSAEERSKVINAVTSGSITLVRTTGAEDVEGFPSYRPEEVGP